MPKKLAKKMKQYNAFTLPEALLVLVIIGVTALLATPFLHVKIESKSRAFYESHGSWECQMYPEGGYIQTTRTFDGKIKKQENAGSSCSFKQPPGAFSYNVDICGNHSELENCNYYDASHVLIHYPTLRDMNNIRIESDAGKKKVKFGELAYAIYRGGVARVLIVY